MVCALANMRIVSGADSAAHGRAIKTDMDWTLAVACMLATAPRIARHMDLEELLAACTMHMNHEIG